MAKKKKEKIVWVDDGRTIADMSALGSKAHSQRSEHGKPLRYRAPLKEQLRTFFDAMGFMLLPTLALVGILIAAFAIVYLLF